MNEIFIVVEAKGSDRGARSGFGSRVRGLFKVREVVKIDSEVGDGGVAGGCGGEGVEVHDDGLPCVGDKE